MTALLEVHDIHTAYGELARAVRRVARGRGQASASACSAATASARPRPCARSWGSIRRAAARSSGGASRSPAGPPFRIARLGLGFVPEDRRIFAELTVWENLDVARRVSGRSGPWTIEAVFELFPKLDELRERQGGFLSGGEQQMLTIARTLMLNPELLLLDEPSEGLAPLVVDQLLRAHRRAEAPGPHDPARRAGRRLLAFPGRPGVCPGEGRGALLGASRPAQRRRRSAPQAACTLTVQAKEETAMPFVNIRILKGHPQERKDEIARRVTETISEVAKLPKEAVWVVFEDVTADDWYVGQSRVSELQKKAAQSGSQSDQVVSGVEIRDKRFESVVGRSVDFERLATGCIFTEGPLWHRREKYLLFSDMPGDHLRRWSQKDGVTTFRKPCNKSNGLAWDLQGRLIACEHASSHLTRTEADGTHHGARQPLRRQGAQQPQRRGREERRRHLLLRPDLRPQAAFRRAARAAAGLPRRLSPRPGRQDAHPARRRLRAAERPVLLARREDAVRQRHRQAAHPCLRREGATARSPTAASGRRRSATGRARPTA